MRALKLIMKLEGYIENDSLPIYLDKFIQTINSLAGKCKVDVLTDLDSIRDEILYSKTKVLRGDYLRKALESKDISRKVKAFNVLYKTSLKAFIGVMKSLDKEKRLNKPIKDIVKPFLSLEVGEK